MVAAGWRNVGLEAMGARRDLFIGQALLAALILRP
jgi:hypothetical protein